MDEFYIGGIIAWASSRIPVNFMLCQGQELKIQEHAALYSIIGITYGGDGRITFNLPDLRFRTPIGVGSNVFSINNQTMNFSIPLGGTIGSPATILTINQLPSHTHQVVITDMTITGTAKGSITPKCLADSGDKSSPEGNAMAKINNGYASPTDATNNMASISGNFNVSGTGNGLARANSTGNGNIFTNMQPSLGLNWIICISGTYPPFP